MLYGRALRMRINHIELHNLGPYAGTNNFVLNSNDSNKNIVLVGGKNGAGKSTLFNSIKVCLYGNRALGYQTNNANYFAEVKKLINNDVKYKKNGSAKISLEIQLDGSYENKYIITREWTIKDKNIQEEIYVYLNGNQLSKEERLDFESYLFNIIPPDIFKFYFFDGEKIGDFFLDSKNDNSFRNAFLKIFKFDNFSILINNFERINAQNASQTSAFMHYNELLNKLSNQESTIAKLQEMLSSINMEVQQTEDQLTTLLNNYETIGGIHLNEWIELNKQLSSEEHLREDTYKWLRDTANNVIPFIIMSKQLKLLAEQINRENEIKRQRILISEIEKEEVRESIRNVLSKPINGSTEKYVDSIIIELKKSFGLDQIILSQELILDLSGNHSAEILSEINNILGYNIKRISEANLRIKKSLANTKSINKKISSFNIKAFEEFNEQRNKYIAKLKILNEEKLKTSDLLNLEMLSFKNINDEYTKAKKSYEQELRQKSVNDLSSKMLLLFLSLEEVLFRKQTENIERIFLEIFNSIINRSGFLDGISIDSNFNAIPYRNRNFSKKEATDIVKKFGMQYFENNLGKARAQEINKALLSNNKVVTIPVPIDNSFSQGERQIFVMALYFALIKSSNSNIPFIIDTPFARIDKEHRSKIIEHFFKQLNSQIFILSTNEEIIGEYHAMLQPKISDTFLLSYEAEGKTKVTKNKYFEVANDI